MKSTKRNVTILATLTLLVAGLTPLASSVRADDGGPVAVSIGTAGDFEGVLLDGRGRAIYAFLNDRDGVSACYDACATNWPPVIGEGLDGDGIDAALVGTHRRRDGATQVTYGGHPLYTFANDTRGTAAGQGVRDLWYLIDAAGKLVGLPEAAEADATEADATDAAEADADDVMTIGAGLYQTYCAVCHGAEGAGNIGPRLDGNGNLRRPLGIIGPILWGFPPNMPAFGGMLNDEQVAALGTYVRNAWTNAFGAVTPEEVAGRR
jgi:predicted lipoprotein with Yx(FWY)xxD motif/cytochrome c5